MAQTDRREKEHKDWMRKKQAFTEIMESQIPPSPPSKLQNEIDDRLFVMETIIAKLAAEQLARAPKTEELKEASLENEEVTEVLEALEIILETTERETSVLEDRKKIEQVTAVDVMATPNKKFPTKPTFVRSEMRIASLQPPRQKFQQKYIPYTNKPIILNALQYSVFPGAVNNDKLVMAKGEICGSTSKHFLILFRDYRCQFRGIYIWDQKSDEVSKLSGQGPPKVTADAIKILFKYNSGSKSFQSVPAKHFGNNIDAFTIEDSYWMKPKTILSISATSTNC